MKEIALTATFNSSKKLYTSTIACIGAQFLAAFLFAALRIQAEYNATGVVNSVKSKSANEVARPPAHEEVTEPNKLPRDVAVPSGNRGESDFQNGLKYYGGTTTGAQGFSASFVEYVKANEYFRRAAAQGHAKAQTYLGHMCRNGLGAPRNSIEAISWYRKAALQGDAEAQNNLGGMYYSGDGVAKDYSEAYKWCRKSADQGYAEAQCFLSVMYLFGHGVEKDSAEALSWIRKAADQGFAMGQYGLGRMYSNGDGVTKDEVEAYAYFYLASVSVEAAEAARAKLAGTMSAQQISDAQERAKRIQAASKH